jgi:hypothetical protein
MLVSKLEAAYSAICAKQACGRSDAIRLDPTDNSTHHWRIFVPGEGRSASKRSVVISMTFSCKHSLTQE